MRTKLMWLRLLGSPSAGSAWHGKRNASSRAEPALGDPGRDPIPGRCQGKDYHISFDRTPRGQGAGEQRGLPLTLFAAGRALELIRDLGVSSEMSSGLDLLRRLDVQRRNHETR